MAKINTTSARGKLDVRREPHWADAIAEGLFLGFRKLDEAGKGTWIARYRYDGAQKYRSIGSVQTTKYEDAIEEARKFAKECEAGVAAQGVDTVADACRDYVGALRGGKIQRKSKKGEAKKQRSPEECKLAADDAQRRFERTVFHDRIGKVPLHRLREHDVEAWRDRVEHGTLAKLPAVKGRPPTAKPLSPASVNRMRTALVAALNHAVKRRNVAAERSIEWENVEPYGGGARRDLYLTRTQRAALLQHAQGDLRDLIECVILTGCRPGDPAAVRLKDYDARLGMVTFRTKGHERTIRLVPQAKALFDRLAKFKTPAAYLFSNNGRPWTAKEWGAQVREAARAAELPDGFVLYTLRHCWITDALVGGVDVMTVAKLAGTSISMIDAHYGHLIQSAEHDKLAAVQML